MRILVTGSTGLLGPYLMAAFSRLGETIGISSKDCDLTDYGQVQKLGLGDPDMIVHAAAMTDVDLCEKEPNRAVLCNLVMVENIVHAMPEGCRFVHISSDMVYSGRGPHREKSRSENPLNMYGISKFMGEFAAAKARNHLIVRTNLFGIARSAQVKSSLADFLIQKMRSGVDFNVFTDAAFSPLWTKTFAERLVHMARTDKVGTFNLGSTGGMSKAKFAMLLANELGLSVHGMRPLESAAIPSRVARPLDTRLDLARTVATFGFALPALETEIHLMCQDIKCTN